jgi:hypothetical protein
VKAFLGTCALGVALLAGCAAPAAWRGGEERQAADLVAYANRVAAMDAAAQRRERDWAMSAQAREKSDLARVRLGLLYALPSSAIQDDARAAPLLEGAADGAGALGQVARFAAAQVRERQRQVAEEQKRTDMVKQQLEALKAIERSILERAARRRPEVR